MLFSYLLIGGLLGLGAVAVYRAVVKLLNRTTLIDTIKNLFHTKAPENEAARQVLNSYVAAHVKELEQTGSVYRVKVDALTDEGKVFEAEITSDRVEGIQVDDYVTNIYV